MKSIIAVILAVLSTVVSAKPAPPSVYLYNLSTGQTIVAENTYEVRPIASVTKLMTAMVAIDHSNDLTKQLKISNMAHHFVEKGKPERVKTNKFIKS